MQTVAFEYALDQEVREINGWIDEVYDCFSRLFYFNFVVCILFSSL